MREGDPISPNCGFDPSHPTCYKRLFCAGCRGLESYFSCPMIQHEPGASSDAAKLQHSFTGLAVEACSEFRKQCLGLEGVRHGEFGVWLAGTDMGTGRQYLNTFSKIP